MRGGSQLVDRFSSRRLGEGRPSRSAGRAVGEAAEAQPLCACCKVVAAAIDACADAGVGATAVTAAAAAASLSAGSVDADATDAEAAPGLSPSTKSGALAIQTGQPSSVGAVRLRFELKLGLGGWNCGLKTLGCEGVDSVNEGVRSAAFDEGVRLAGRLRLGDVACSAASSDSLAAWGCVSLAGVSIATAALAFAQLQKLFLAPGEITWGREPMVTLRSDFTCDAASRTKRARVEPGSRACASLRMPASR